MWLLRTVLLRSVVVCCHDLTCHQHWEMAGGFPKQCGSKVSAGSRFHYQIYTVVTSNHSFCGCSKWGKARLRARAPELSTEVRYSMLHYAAYFFCFKTKSIGSLSGQIGVWKRYRFFTHLGWERRGGEGFVCTGWPRRPGGAQRIEKEMGHWFHISPLSHTVGQSDARQFKRPRRTIKISHVPKTVSLKHLQDCAPQIWQPKLPCVHDFECQELFETVGQAWIQLGAWWLPRMYRQGWAWQDGWELAWGFLGTAVSYMWSCCVMAISVKEWSISHISSSPSCSKGRPAIWSLLIVWYMFSL